MVRCDKHSSQVFSICDSYLYEVNAQLDRMSYSSRHDTETRVALVKAPKNKANPATDQKVALTEQSQFKD